MDTLLEVGLVEGVTAALFVGFCVLINFLIQPRKRTERELAQLLTQIAEPERTIPPPMIYRGVTYQPTPTLSLAMESDSPQQPLSQRSISRQPVRSPETFSPLPSSVSVPHSVVRLTYRGVTYLQENFESDS